MKPSTPLDPMDISNHPFLSNLQGNILKGHGRDHTTHIFVHFDARREKTVREWLHDFSEEQVTSFQKQLKEREVFKRTKIGGDIFASVFLTKAGYNYLGYTDVAVQLPDEGFNAGMKGRLATNNDPALSKWEKGFRQEIHAMILLADDDLGRMGTFAKSVLASLDQFSHICSVEYGNVIRNANGDGLEHFGYVDGVSQPLFLKDEVDEYMNSHNTSSQDARFNPTTDLDVVLIPDPYAKNADSFGSYFVFRKLEQNVRGFNDAEEKLNLGELGGAYVVGRFEDGTPVVQSQYDNISNSGKFNNFNYDSDPSGGRCPHFAHIRKVNPRETVISSDGSPKKPVMARRGIPFGRRAVDTALDPSLLQMPEGGVGLLFMSFQASIKEQFELIQQKLANDADVPQADRVIDPIIGQSSGGNGRKYDFPNQYDDLSAGTTNKGFDQFVHMKGGEYFFAPSLSFFKSI